MQDTIAQSLGIIPYREINVPFNIWYEHYKSDIFYLYSLFEDKLWDVAPFCDKNFNDDKMQRKFALMLYKSSSRMIK